MENIKSIFILLILGGVVIQLLRSKLSLVHAIIFLVPYKTITLDLGIGITAAHFFMFFWYLDFFLKGLKEFLIHKYLFLFLLYGVISTLFLSTLVIDPVHTGAGEFFRNEGRFITQIILKVFLQFGLFFIILNSIRTKRELYSLLKVWLFSWVVLALLGIVQFFIYQITRIDIFPIGHVNIDFLRYGGEINILGIPWVRICSLGGEPKGLGATLAVGLAVLYSFTSNNISITKFDKFLIPVFLIAVLMTLSTGAIMMLGVVFITPVMLKILHLEFKIGALSPKVILISIVLIFSTYKSFPYLQSIYKARIVERFESQGTIEDMDLTIISFIKANPKWLVFGSGWGNIHSLSNDYIPRRYKYYMKESVYIAKSGYLYLISEMGIVGVILFFVMVAKLVLKLLKNRKNKHESFALYTLGIVLLFLYLLRANYVIYEFIIVLAIIAVYNRIERPYLRYEQ